jgi:hypothetical protein
MRYILSFVLTLAFYQENFSQIDTSRLFNARTPFGPLDIRLSGGSNHHYYLQENTTFSFREIDQDRTDHYVDMTAWDSSPYGEGQLREKTDSSNLFVMNYRLLTPQGYNRTFPEGYPLVVVMHGFLERGNCAESNCYHADKNYSPNKNIPPAPTSADHELLNNDYHLIHAGSNYLEAHQVNGSRLPTDFDLPSKGFPGFVLFPQNLNGWNQSEAENVIRLTRLLSKKYNIDENRIYINGISHGGHGAYEVLKRAPWMFAAAIMFSAADDASVISQKMTAEISHIPLWIFQGALDTNPSQAKTENYIKAFRKAGANVRYTLYSYLGHGTWNEAMEEPDFFSWMLAQNRTRIHVFGGNAAICKTSGSSTVLTLPEGFASYQWEYNGLQIHGASTNSYTAREPGIYRGRFLISVSDTGEQWGNWSETREIGVKNPEAPEIKQIGTLLLPDLNGYPNAQLEAASHSPYYYWQKDGQPVQLGKTPNDTAQLLIVEPPTENGWYSVRVADYDRCKSQESARKYIIFNDEAAVNIASPFAFAANAASPSEVILTWSDTASNEHSFEIWRRSQEVTGELTPWELAGLVSGDNTSFTDKDVSPSTAYLYKIRAINDMERSLYTPEGEDALGVATPADTEAPGAPAELSAHAEGIKSIRLNWIEASDNSSVEEYIVFYNDDSVHTSSADTTFLLKELDINTVYSIKVQAVDRAGNVSAFSNTAQADTYVTGLYYEHSTGAWQNLGEVDWSIAEFTGMVDNFTLVPKTQDDFFNFFFDGFLSIAQGGVYQFRLTSDDGSNLSLNDTLLIENDGIHNVNTVTSPVQLIATGPQRISVKYFDYVKSDTLLVEYKGPDTDNEWIKIPPHVLQSNLVTEADDATITKASSIAVFPNPTTGGNINIRGNNLTGPFKLSIHDNTGKLLFHQHFDQMPDEPLQLQGVSALNPGMYIISIEIQNLPVAKKKLIIR